MRIGIATIFRGNHNYGGMLQAYALQHKIKELVSTDSKVETLNYIAGRNPIYPTLLSRCFQYSLKQIIEKIMMIKTEKKTYRIADKLKLRHKLFDEFIANYICQSPLYLTSEIEKVASDYDVLICGSDQIWNPNVVNNLLIGDVGTGNNIKRISYAASIGRSMLGSKEKKFYYPRLKKFDKISVREKTAFNILKELNLNIDVEVVLDPTMLLTAEEWGYIAKERLINTPYVLLYSFSDCRFKKEIQQYYENEGKTVVYIPYVKQKYNTFDARCKMKALWDIGPREFLSLIKYADVIYTDSFHGTVFSVLFNKTFFVYNRNIQNSKTSMNSRLNDLLAVLNLEKQMITNEEPLLDVGIPIEYELVENKIKELRSNSLTWLDRAIHYDKNNR